MIQNNSKIIFILLSISFLATLVTQIRPELIISFSMNNYYLLQGNYIHTVIQFFTSQFIHGDYLHLLFNSVFIFIFGNYIAKIISDKILTLFFIYSSTFIGISLIIFSNAITIGMSGFALALLSYYGLELFTQKNNEYKGALFAIFLNIIIGLTPGISLLGHLFGAISGITFFILYKLFKLISSKKID